ncbi:MAG: tetratricopeptide repeat protein [Sulfuricurvum sp.]|nr:tetratricopeptide repeat protein [Sulfuricurvum sp.]
MTYNAAAIYEVLSLALTHHREGRLEEAEKLYRVVLHANANHPDANYNFAVLAVDLGYVEESLPFFEKAIELHSVSKEYYFGYIDALIRLDKMDRARIVLEEAKWISSKEAVESLQKRIPEQELVPEKGQKLNILELMKTRNSMKNKEPSAKEIERWNTLFSGGNYQEAEKHSRKMTKKYPDSGNAWKLLGAVLMQIVHYQEAFYATKMAIKLLPGDPEAQYNLGVAYQGLGMIPQAEECYHEALKIQPTWYQAYGNLGIIYNEQGKFPKAIEYYRRALAINPQICQVYNNLGSAFNSQGSHVEAREYYYKALEAEPTHGYVFGNILFSLNYDPDLSAEEIYAAYQEYNRRFALPLAKYHKPYTNDQNPHRRLKVGYVSPDFKQHSVRHFLEPLLANHDKSVVEVYAYAEIVKEDEMSQMYKGYCDHWIPTVGMSDEVLAQRIRSDGIDILVELAGHTNNNRLGVFARKPAPVSLSWMGYGYTTGLSAIDYYLTDEISVPEGSEHLFSEEPWKIESPSYAYSPAAGMGEVSLLPFNESGYITFGTLTRAVRVNHRTIRVWAELLKRVPNSKLIINSKDYRDPSMKEILVQRFNEHGIDKDRLEIGYSTPPWNVLRRMDIGVDCFPHNSGTTLFETLYMGVPYVTLADRASVGRLGSGILHGVGRDEWIAHTEEEYIDKLVSLASDIPALASIRAGLREEMIKSPLMDGVGFARKVEKGYKEMFARWCQGQQ